jgi:dTDP-glucose 4,6-dehydratase
LVPYNERKARVLVTGSEGTIGRPLCKYLEAQGHVVTKVDLAHGEHVQRADIAIYDQIARVVDEAYPHVVFNLAAEFGRHNGEAFSQQLWASNAVGMKNMLRLQRACGFKLIHASSSEVYGEGPWDVDLLDEGVTERCALRHHNDYAMSKWVNEQQARIHGGDVVIPRFFNSYGPGEEYHPYRSVVCLFAYSSLHDLPYTVYRGYNRVFMHVADFVPSLARCMTLPAGTTINIGGSEYRSVEDLHEIIQREVGTSESEVTFLDQDGHNTVSKRPDISKARNLLGHDPQVTLEGGIYETVAWMRERYSR